MASESNTDYRKDLLELLEERGWSWQGDFIYAPHKMLWLHRDLDFGSLEEFYERFSERLNRMKRIKPPADDSAPYYEVISDNESLVGALDLLLKSSGL